MNSSARGGGSQRPKLPCGGIGDIEDLARGWTAKPQPITGQRVLVNMLNPNYAGQTVTVIGPYKDGRVPVSTPEGEEIRVRPRNLALSNSEAALHPRTPQEAERYLQLVASENGRIPAADVQKLGASPPCEYGGCARACWAQPGMFAPAQVKDMIDRGVFDPNGAVLDFFSDMERPSVGIVRPRTVEERGASLSAFKPTPGIPCANLGPNGCVLPRDHMPINCISLHCNKEHHVPLDKHSAAYSLWDTPEGREVVDWFQRQIRARDPQAPTTEVYFLQQTLITALDENLRFAHEIGCARLPAMIELVTARMKTMVSAPDPEILSIIERELATRLKYANEMECSLLGILQKSMNVLKKLLARK